MLARPQVLCGTAPPRTRSPLEAERLAERLDEGPVSERRIVF